MKIAYLSNYKELTGYSYAARGYIKALNVVDDINLVCRNISITNKNDSFYDKSLYFEEVDESATLKGVDVTILHTLPHFYKRANKCKTIGMVAWETSCVPKLWVDKINKETDGIIVFNEMEKDVFMFCGVEVPVYVVPHHIAVSEKTPNKKAFLTADFIDEETYVFYTMSELNPRKNFEDMITCYYSAFDGNDNCIFYIHVFGGKQQEEELKQACEYIKNSLGKDSYPKIILNYGEISDNELMNMHFVGDTYVSLSHGESWNIPACTAYLLSKNMILSTCGGHREFCKTEDYFVDCFKTPVVGMNIDLYKNSGYWQGINLGNAIDMFKHSMRNEKVLSKKHDDCEIYNPDNIGQKLYSALKEINE